MLAIWDTLNEQLDIWAGDIAISIYVAAALGAQLIQVYHRLDVWCEKLNPQSVDQAWPWTIKPRDQNIISNP